MKPVLIALIPLSIASFLAHAGPAEDFIKSTRMSIDAEYAVTSEISKCDIQSGNSKISFGGSCESYLNYANSYLFNILNKELSVKWRRSVVKYAKEHKLKLDQRFTSDL